jgi:hypothetical protein
VDEIVSNLLNPESFQDKGSIGKKVTMVDNEGRRGIFLSILSAAEWRI